MPRRQVWGEVRVVSDPARGGQTPPVARSPCIPRQPVWSAALQFTRLRRAPRSHPPEAAKSVGATRRVARSGALREGLGDPPGRPYMPDQRTRTGSLRGLLPPVAIKAAPKCRSPYGDTSPSGDATLLEADPNDGASHICVVGAGGPARRAGQKLDPLPHEFMSARRPPMHAVRPLCHHATKCSSSFHRSSGTGTTYSW